MSGFNPPDEALNSEELFAYRLFPLRVWRLCIESKGPKDHISSMAHSLPIQAVWQLKSLYPEHRRRWHGLILVGTVTGTAGGCETQ